MRKKYECCMKSIIILLVIVEVLGRSHSQNKISVTTHGVATCDSQEEKILIQEIKTHLRNENEAPSEAQENDRAYKFLNALSSSKEFRQNYWHKKPFLIRKKDTGGWIAGAFTVERDLKMVGGSYITGHRTADALRNGTTTDTWKFLPIKEDPSKPTTWEEVETALRGGTIYFNTAGSLWPELGALCLITSSAFGLPANVNVYVTPPSISLSVPPHTDKQDVLVFQTQGAKRWRVYAPPKRKMGVDPLSRGKAGDVMEEEELGDAMVDTVLRPGDLLYVPAGFPHTTDTAHSPDPNETFDQTSLHLTMGLDTHVWFLTYAHLRWASLQRSNKNFSIQIQNDTAYWRTMDTIPIGFLSGEWKDYLRNIVKGEELVQEYLTFVREELKRIMIELEPHRWKLHPDDVDKEPLPSDEEIDQLVQFIVSEHLPSLFEIQRLMFTDIKPNEESTIWKAYRGTQEQNSVMERFAEFCGNDAMRESFAQRRIAREDEVKKRGF